MVLSLSKIVHVIFLIYSQVTEVQKNNEMIKYDKLKNWALENGAILGKIEINFLTANNRYVVASEDIKKDDIIVSIPHNIIFYHDNPVIKHFCEKYELSETECLSAYMSVHFKNEDNFFNSYFKFLPKDFEFYPSFFSNDLKEKVKGSSIERSEKSWENEIRREHDLIKVGKG
jgi:hypothetical protein